MSMKRTGAGGEGYSVMKKDHYETTMGNTGVADTKYAKSDTNNEPELKASVNALTGYVKSHRMKY